MSRDWSNVITKGGTLGRILMIYSLLGAVFGLFWCEVYSTTARVKRSARSEWNQSWIMCAFVWSLAWGARQQQQQSHFHHHHRRHRLGCCHRAAPTCSCRRAMRSPHNTNQTNILYIHNTHWLHKLLNEWSVEYTHISTYMDAQCKYGAPPILSLSFSVVSALW